MNVLICPDKFKGSLTAVEVANAIANALPAYVNKTCVPMADGGEGSLNVIANNLVGEWRTVTVNDPLFRPISAKYYLSNNIAYIEMAGASGYELLTDSERNCMITTTYGTGELVKDAISQQVASILLFVGGSATNDGGIGVAAALGYKFLDESENLLQPSGENLSKIHKIYVPDKTFSDVKITVVCDVSNPFYGTNGAAYVYATQKGAIEAQVIELDKGLRNIAQIIKNQFDIDLQEIPGSGAAGGLGGGAVAFLNAEIKSGTKTLVDITGLEKKIKNSDLIITGEGKVDKQSISGKLIEGICEIAQKYAVPVWIICGIYELSTDELSNLGVQKIISLVDKEISVEYAMRNAKVLINGRVRDGFSGLL